jgi:peptidoglycan/xylan/chitin deacetylase (PgdA/CDA1 family)
MHNSVPYISFTFDDFPLSALYKGGDILMQFGFHGTYYASFGLMGIESPVGKIFLADDIKELLKHGHELGCHTFSHCCAFITNPKIFENSIIENRHALDALVPGAIFRSFSYPKDGPRLATKDKASKYFSCCRAGGQTYNKGTIDLNILKAFFLEKMRDNPSFIKKLIDCNCKACGWLIFATHDVSDSPSPYGCTPSFFRDIVKYSKSSGARILPVAEALDAIRSKA